MSERSQEDLMLDFQAIMDSIMSDGLARIESLTDEELEQLNG